MFLKFPSQLAKCMLSNKRLRLFMISGVLLAVPFVSSQGQTGGYVVRSEPPCSRGFYDNDRPCRCKQWAQCEAVFVYIRFTPRLRLTSQYTKHALLIGHIMMRTHR